jgi:tetratricopeptide (TPR) repeat protein
MKTTLRRLLLLTSAALLAALGAAPVWATCGGGGGGGMGGVRAPSGPGGTGGPGGQSGGQTYQVPWKVIRGGEKADAAAALVLYWFPVSPTETRGSELQSSRPLSLLTARCVSMAIVPTDNNDLYHQFAASQHAPFVVLASPDGKEIGRVAGDRGPSRRDVEKLLDSELKRREATLDHQLDSAREQEKSGDVDGAASLYKAVWAERCLFPDNARKAAKALKKLGRPVPEDQASALGASQPALAGAIAVRVERVMNAGLAAEDAGRYEEAARLYAQAHRLDAADPVPLRYLGELHRHHTGDWAQARKIFSQLLATPAADPISRAVALHGLGKMTIHDGDFPAGLALLERSIATYPLPLAYRNLAVYWNSDGQVEKARGFAAQALALAPEDPYNIIFFAAFAAEDGRREEALRIAHQNEDLVAASYNLAAIYSLLGDRDKTLAMLQRHFYSYERYDAVRAKEMKEAREDIVFTSVKADPGFVALTAKAEKPAGNRPAAAMPGGRR